MEFQEIFEDLNDLGKYKVTIAVIHDLNSNSDVYIARVEVNGVTKSALSYDGELEALNAVMNLVNNNEDVVEHSDAARVLKAMVDNLGLNKAVSLLKELAELEVENG